jgi:hypothetical protein
MKRRRCSDRPSLPRPRPLRVAVLWSTLVAFLIAGQGVLPSAEWLARVGLIARSDESFPCEGCACGCISAEHCWTNCCCHSLEDRLDWARANGVLVPRSIARRAFVSLQAASARENLPECCRARETCASSSGSHPATCSASCAASGSASGSGSPSASPSASSCCNADGHGAASHAPRAARLRIASISALGCKGAPGWLVHAPLPPLCAALPAAFPATARAMRFRAPRGGAAPESRALDAPAPPPRA